MKKPALVIEITFAGIVTDVDWAAKQAETSQLANEALRDGRAVDLKLLDNEIDNVENSCWSEGIYLTNGLLTRHSGGSSSNNRYFRLDLKLESDKVRTQWAKKSETVARVKVVPKTQRETLGTYGFNGVLIQDAKFSVMGKGDVADPNCRGLTTTLTGMRMEWVKGVLQPRRKMAMYVIDGKLHDNQKKRMRVINEQELLEGLGLAVPVGSDIDEQ